MTNCQYAILWRVESTSGMREGRGLLCRLTIVKAVTRWGFFTGKEGLRYSTVWRLHRAHVGGGVEWSGSQGPLYKEMTWPKIWSNS